MAKILVTHMVVNSLKMYQNVIHFCQMEQNLKGFPLGKRCKMQQDSMIWCANRDASMGPMKRNIPPKRVARDI